MEPLPCVDRRGCSRASEPSSRASSSSIPPQPLNLSSPGALQCLHFIQYLVSSVDTPSHTTISSHFNPIYLTIYRWIYPQTLTPLLKASPRPSKKNILIQTPPPPPTTHFQCIIMGYGDLILTQGQNSAAFIAFLDNINIDRLIRCCLSPKLRLWDENCQRGDKK